MNRYRIGRVEGRWDNFIPPIQGGHFRLSTDNSHNSDDDSTAPPSRPSSSRDQSPVSPTFEGEDPVLRNRYPLAGDRTRSTSVSSAPSVADEDGMAYLDTITKEKITLDLEKYPSLDHTTQDAIVAKYRLLDERMKAERLYDCNYWAYAIEGTRYSILFALFVIFLRSLSAVFGISSSSPPTMLAT